MNNKLFFVSLGVFSFFSLDAFSAASCEQEGWVAGNDPSGSKYALLNKTNQYTLDGDVLNNLNDTVSYYTSEDGFFGSDTMNSIDGFKVKAKKNIAFDEVGSIGPAWVIAIHDDIVYCRNIHVQENLPTISGSTNSTGGSTSTLNVTLNYTVDQSSYAYFYNESAVITLYANTDGDSSNEVVGTARVENEQGAITIRPSGYTTNQGKVYFSAKVFDGGFESDLVDVGTFEKKCQAGASFTYQTGPGNGGHPNPCGVDSNNNRCPASVIPLTFYSYPLLQYTCKAS